MLQPVFNPAAREARDFVYESKFLLSAEQAVLVCDWARAHLSVDPHGSGYAGDLYQVSSLYLDTQDLATFQRRDSYGRSKFRIRRYDLSDSVFAERKTKTRDRVIKRRTLMPVRDLARLQRSLDPAWQGYWFQRRVLLRRLQPVCQISYQRLARMTHSETGACRLTLDSLLTAQPCTGFEFSAAQGPLLIADQHILELKYQHHLPLLFKQLLSEFAPTPRRISKYRLAIAALQLSAVREREVT